MNRTRKIFLFAIMLTTVAIACNQQSASPKVTLRQLDHHWLDSVINHSDSSYSKPYKRTDFVTAFFYLNTKDSSVCQVMKDSVDTVRQIIIVKKDIRVFLAQYYTNGQLQAELKLDEYGQLQGPAIYFYENGVTQTNGNYMHGLKMGKWNSYSKTGTLIATDEYDSNGQVSVTKKN